ncbi:hypothetical protein GXM_07001 [Nostoc sphaeroides CCNUC1]|uniref:Uncharacterized protein n=1 Tax=Nostoc sphaeroides CCNUC1 TaxID=2653204 RepID=A0A5P8W9M7_9NOSO|nr:hypothetical protein GXM_07001 [Nostoc sphaeroides CCNUC1]
MNLGVGFCWVEERNPTPTISDFVGVSRMFNPTYKYFIFSE